jgi:hypothetical protein
MARLKRDLAGRAINLGEKEAGAGSGPRLNPVNIDPNNGAAAQKHSF